MIPATTPAAVPATQPPLLPISASITPSAVTGNAHQNNQSVPSSGGQRGTPTKAYPAKKPAPAAAGSAHGHLRHQPMAAMAVAASIGASTTRSASSIVSMSLLHRGQPHQDLHVVAERPLHPAHPELAPLHDEGRLDARALGPRRELPLARDLHRHGDALGDAVHREVAGDLQRAPLALLHRRALEGDRRV